MLRQGQKWLIVNVKHWINMLSEPRREWRLHNGSNTRLIINQSVPKRNGCANNAIRWLIWLNPWPIKTKRGTNGKPLRKQRRLKSSKQWTLTKPSNAIQTSKLLRRCLTRLIELGIPCNPFTLLRKRWTRLTRLPTLLQANWRITTTHRVVMLILTVTV